MFFLKVLAILGGFTSLIIIHEFGHFLAAKLSKIRVTDFFVGFGPKLVTVKKGETTYGISAILAGGYVKMTGAEITEEEGDKTDARSLDNASFLKKIFIVVMGSVFNLLAAIVILSLVFKIGGFYVPTNIIQGSQKGTPAYIKLKTGDKIIRVNSHRVTNWEELTGQIRKNPNRSITVEALRKGKKTIVRMQTEERSERWLIFTNKFGFLGIYPKLAKVANPGLLMSVKESFGTIYNVAITINQLIFKALGGQPGALVKSSSSVVGAVYVGAKVSTTSVKYLGFIAYMSFVLGYFNLFPIPPLDGGRALLYVIEKLKRSAFNKKTLLAINGIGLALLLTMFILLLVKDLIGGLPNV